MKIPEKYFQSQKYIPNQIIIVLDGPIKKDLKHFIYLVRWKCVQVAVKQEDKFLEEE